MIKKVYENLNVGIVFAVDDGFAVGLSTTIESIVCNATENNYYDIVVLYKSFSKEFQEAIKSQQTENISIRFVNPEKYARKYKIFSQNVIHELYYRLLIPELFEEYDKVIYIDGDMIVTTDISELYQINLEGYYFAAVKDYCGIWHYYDSKDYFLREYLENEIHMPNPTNYINAGLLVMNLVALRNEYGIQNIWRLVDERAWKHHDQDIINMIGKVNILPYRWNQIADISDYGKSCMPIEETNDWESSFGKPGIIHFTGQNKPWAGKKVWGYEEFWKYAVQCPLLEEMCFPICSDDIEKRIKKIIKRKKIGAKQLGGIILFSLRTKFCDK